MIIGEKRQSPYREGKTKSKAVAMQASKAEAAFFAQILAALSRLIAAGHNETDARALFEQALARAASRGHVDDAANGQPWHAPACKNSDAEGQKKVANTGVDDDDSASEPNCAAGGQKRVAENGQLANATLPREQSAERRAARRRAAKRAALTVLDTMRIDGQALGDFTVAEAMRAGRQKTYEGRLLLALTRMVANPEPWAKLRTIVKIDEVQRAMQAAAEVADNV